MVISVDEVGHPGEVFLFRPASGVQKGWVRRSSMRLARAEFEELVVSALKRLPRSIKRKIENVDVVIERQASGEILGEMGLDSPFELLGLYQGIPLDQRGFYYGNVLPDKITLFQLPIEALCNTSEEIREKVRDVVVHEVGHYFGLSDERLRQLEQEDDER